MDLRKEILKEHSRAQVNRILAYIGNDQKKFNDLIDIYITGPYRVTQRASWPLSCCVEATPSLVIPHLKKLIDVLAKTDVHDAVKRNTFRLLQYIEIPKRLQGKIADLSFQYLQNKKEPVAIRCFAMTVLYNITVDNPELRPELQIIIEDNLPYAKPAFVSRAKKILKALKVN